MNSLSWLIYWANVVEGIRGLFFTTATLGVVVSIFAATHGFIEGDRQSFRYLRITVPCIVLSALLSIFTPTKDTLYAIAASEFGEEVLKTPEANKARAALNAWLDEQIKPEKPE